MIRRLSYQKWLFLIMVSAFTVRVIGINYGLPLWLPGDEPPFITAALKMIELKTIVPALHMDEFKATLYFPPYLAYLYVMPFSLLLGIKYLLFSGTFLAFKNYIISDLSQFFLIARFLSALLGTATVWLTYRISKNILKDEPAAILSAFFLTFSVLHIYLSLVARDWVPATFLFTLGMWVLSRPNMTFKSRYLIAAAISGMAFGVSLIAAFLMLFVLYWYLFYEQHNILEVFKEKTLYWALLIFSALGALSITLYPYGFHLSTDNSIATPKPLIGFATYLITFLKPVLISEPLLIIFSVFGLIAIFKARKNYFWNISAFIFSYIFIFYFMYHYEQRFTIYLFPLLAITAGYGFASAYRAVSALPLRIILLVTLLIPTMTAMRMNWLTLRNDSRMQAREWIENNIPENTKIMVYSEMTRLASNSDAIKEQAILDRNSLRKVDEGESYFQKNPHNYTTFHALNLYAVQNRQFYDNILDYAASRKYAYLVLSESTQNDDQWKVSDLQKLASVGREVNSFGSFDSAYSMRDGNFGSPLSLFRAPAFGPKIKIYQLPQ